LGDTYWGLHAPLAALVRQAGVRVAVETGTYFGSGTIQLSAMFDRVFTVDIGESRILALESLYNDTLGNVEFIVGDSGNVLRGVCSKIDEAALFVLDAHWFPGPGMSESSGSQCPLDSELDVLRDTKVAQCGSYVFIDDADMLLRSLPDGFRDEDFPTIVNVVDRLRDIGFKYIDVCDDVIIAGPGGLADLEREYLQLRSRLGRPDAKSLGIPFG